MAGTGTSALDPSLNQFFPMNLDMPQVDGTLPQQTQQPQQQQQQQMSPQQGGMASGGVFMGAGTPGAPGMM